MDYAVRATAAQGTVRAFACTSKELVGEAVKIHGCTMTAAAALGRTLTVGAMMGTMMLQNETDKLTLQINSRGPIGGIIVVADHKGNVKGEVYNPKIDVYTKNDGKKLDVGKAVGKGVLNVIKDLAMKEPYIGQIPLVSGEIAEDFTNYFAVSEQIPSAVALGVLVEPDGTIKSAGGLIVQLMPGAEDEVITHLEKFFGNGFSISHELESGKTPEDILKDALGELDLQIFEKPEIKYNCDCNRERFERGLISLGKKEINDIITDDGKAEIVCQFCKKKYEFDKADLEKLLNEIG